MPSECIPADHAALFRAADGGAALCTIVGIDGSFSRRIGTQLAVAADGSRVGDMADKCLDAELAAQASAAIAEGSPRMLRYGQGSPFVDFRLPCGAGLDLLIDPAPDLAALRSCVDRLGRREKAVLDLGFGKNGGQSLLHSRHYIPGARIVLLGAGAECAALVDLCRMQGIACEWREAGEGLQLGQAPDDLEVDPWTAVLLLFHDHEWEHALLQWALDTPAFLIGAQGGAPAREQRIARLLSDGRTDPEVERIQSPVGLIAHARDAGVLALSVLAAVVAAYEDLHPHR